MVDTQVRNNAIWSNKMYKKELSIGVTLDKRVIFNENGQISHFKDFFHSVFPFLVSSFISVVSVLFILYRFSLHSMNPIAASLHEIVFIRRKLSFKPYHWSQNKMPIQMWNICLRLFAQWELPSTSQNWNYLQYCSLCTCCCWCFICRRPSQCKAFHIASVCQCE